MLAVGAGFRLVALLGLCASLRLVALLILHTSLHIGAIALLTVCGLTYCSGVTNCFFALLLNLITAALRSGRLQGSKEERKENQSLFHFFISIEEIKPSGFTCAVT